MKNPAPKLDTTPMLSRQVIELYSIELSDVSFPDLDLAALLNAQSELHTAQLEIERIEEELAEARALHARSCEALTHKTERALAYARIFAQGDPTLGPRIAEIGRKKSNPQTEGAREREMEAPIKKRGRKPKSDAPTELFTEAPEQAHAQLA